VAPATYSVVLLPKVAKVIERLAPKIRAQVLETVDSLERDPRPPGCRKLTGVGGGLWRVRSGNYRIVYEIRDRELRILVVRVGHRREVYRL
jgi:mRNA interferase RelE/StbE